MFFVTFTCLGTLPKFRMHTSAKRTIHNIKSLTPRPFMSSLNRCKLMEGMKACADVRWTGDAVLDYGCARCDEMPTLAPHFLCWLSTAEHIYTVSLCFSQQAPTSWPLTFSPQYNTAVFLSVQLLGPFTKTGTKTMLPQSLHFYHSEHFEIIITMTRWMHCFLPWSVTWEFCTHEPSSGILP